jgi:hypothetical protein
MFHFKLQQSNNFFFLENEDESYLKANSMTQPTAILAAAGV